MRSSRHNGEAQFIDEISSLMRDGTDGFSGKHWDPGYRIPWQTVGPVMERYWHLDGSDKWVFVEKSPPNTCRAAQIREYWSERGDTCFLSSIRNPYAVRYGPRWWITFAEYVRWNRENMPNLVHINYEDWTSNVESACSLILRKIPALDSLNPEAGRLPGNRDVRKAHGIRNLNRIDPRIAQTRRPILAKRQDLLDYFGYRL